MDVLKSYLKDPEVDEKYALDWADRLDSQGVAPSDVVGWDVIVPAGLVEVHRARYGTVTAVWLGGGVVGEVYIVTYVLRIAHPAGSGTPLTWQRSIRVTVAEQ